VVITTPEGHNSHHVGNCHGEIIPEERGTDGFGYDPIFLLPDLGKTMAEISMALKNQRSHRALAIQAARETILVADSSKWNVVTLVQIATLTTIDRLVTDDGLPEGAIAAIEAEGIEVITPARYGRAEAPTLEGQDEHVFQAATGRIH